MPISRGHMHIAAAVVLCVAAATPLQASEEYRFDPETGWKKLPSKTDPDTPDGRIQQVRRLLAAGEYDDAWDAAEQWLEEYPNHPLRVEARLVLGDAKVGAGHHYKALWDYEYVCRYFPGTEQFETALQREYEIGARLLAGLKVRTQLIPFKWFTAQSEGVELMIRIHERAPGTPLGEKAVITLADYYFEESQMRLASIAYERFLVNYPRSIYREKALLRLIQASLATFKGPEFDASGLVEAAERLRAYGEEFPASAEKLGVNALLVRIEESQALKTFYTGRWHERAGKKQGAIYLYQRVVNDYPRTAAAKAALERLEDLGVPLIKKAQPVKPQENAGENKDEAESDSNSDDEKTADGKTGDAEAGTGEDESK